MRIIFCLVVFSISIILLPLSHGFIDRSPDKLNRTSQGNGISAEELELLEPSSAESLTTPTTPLEELSVQDLEVSEESQGFLKSEDCQCGLKNEGNGIDSIFPYALRRIDIEPLIIPGDAAVPREFPWIAAITKLKYGGKQVVCGGSLVNSKYVVTAAHCIKNQISSRMEVLFNVHNASQFAVSNDSMVERRKIKRFIVHSGWNEKTVDNDIGLIELDKPIDFSTSPVRPICLPLNYSYNAFDGLNGTVAGWGYTTPGGRNSQVLNKIAVPIYSLEDCQEKTVYGDKVLAGMICAGFEQGGRDACTNDSGGPLTVEEDGRTILVGIVSWGHGCARPKAPGVYTRVTQYIDWINKHMTKGETCSG
ncbi:unnamed protein product [Allacma fusca]|uniref:Peptidase S1 domain-containing protein n=1 Tax=Allacma fusca TaxID=39272 RepID=A0A8J2NG37_9HEXA|nr:unnamed protein product [Allacma fusca]